MKQGKFRGLNDKDLLSILQHHERALLGAGRAVGKQQSFNRYIAIGVGLLYVVAAGQAGWYNGAIAWLRMWW